MDSLSENSGLGQPKLALREVAARVFMILVFLFFLYLQFFKFRPDLFASNQPSFHQGLHWTRWFLITLLFLLFLSAYIIRNQTKELAKGWKEILIPLFCAGLPLGIILFPKLICNWLVSNQYYDAYHLIYPYILQFPAKDLVLFGLPAYSTLYIGSLIILGIGEIITVGGIFTLRGSFSISTEARQLKTTGLYRYIRHPLYAGEILSIWGHIGLNYALLPILFTVLFTVLQLWRAKIEERKLSRVFPEYHDFKKNVGFIFPKWKRIST